jgi:hypothetical protein
VLPVPPDSPSYLPSRIRACPRCRDTSRVQVILYGMPAFPPSPEEEDRIFFAGCMWPYFDEEPQWKCPACDVYYTGRGVVVADVDWNA